MMEMPEYADVFLILLAAIVVTLIGERKKKKDKISLLKHLEIILLKVAVSAVVVLGLLYLFGPVLKVPEAQLALIVAAGGGTAYAIVSYYLDKWHFYDK